LGLADGGLYLLSYAHTHDEEGVEILLTDHRLLVSWTRTVMVVNDPKGKEFRVQVLEVKLVRLNFLR
jgi:hypothetical protein